MRPAGLFGDVARALIAEAARAPAPVSVLAQRAQVGRSAAQWTASRLLDRGVLEVKQSGRPAVVGLAESPGAAAQPGAAVQPPGRVRSFWEYAPSAEGAAAD